MSDGPLILPSLEISGFRGINHLSIPELGQVTLLTGDNGVGLTTALDAFDVFSARGRVYRMAEILRQRGEFIQTFDEDDLSPILDWRSLFYNREPGEDDSIHIGARIHPNNTDTLSIEFVTLSGEELVQELPPMSRSPFRPEPMYGSEECLRISFNDTREVIPFSELRRPRSRLFDQVAPQLFGQRRARPQDVNCTRIGPVDDSEDSLARIWDKLVFTGDDSRAIRAVNVLLSKNIESVACVGEERRPSMRGGPGRRVVVKLVGQRNAVPLKSLGYGAFRLFGVALHLVSLRDGFALIDNPGNGMDESHNKDVWRVIFEIAGINNLQAVAISHNSLMAAGFVQVAEESPWISSRLLRLTSDGKGTLDAAEYSEKELTWLESVSDGYTG